jgi:UDP-N-acetylglucosamine 2-epimerase
MSLRIVSIVGARPQFVKLAPLCRAVSAHNAAGRERIEHLIVHTGQHYDAELSDVFFDELEIPRADINLGVGSGPHGQQTGRMLEAFEQVILDARPDAVLVYGDTNSTIAGALVAAKQRVPVAHVEAGLRSFNRDMPEEINRVATDHASDLLFAPTPTAMALLGREGLGLRAVFTGDVGHDVVRIYAEAARRKSTIHRTLDLVAGQYCVLTAHRSENADAATLHRVICALERRGAPDLTIVFPMHPRTVSLLGPHMDELQSFRRLRIIRPVGFLDMLALLDGARMVLTDSGGLQKEAFFVGTPCITLRKETEWVETVDEGANVLVGMDPEAVIAAAQRVLAQPYGPRDRHAASAARIFGDGRAAERIVESLVRLIAERRRTRAVVAA